MKTSIVTKEKNRDRKTSALILGIGGLVALSLTLTAARAQSLDEALGVGKTEYQASKSTTVDLWNNLVATLERSGFDEGLRLAKQFAAVDDVTEPYQKKFVGLVINILEPTGQFVMTDTVSAKYTSAIADLKAQRAVCLNEAARLDGQIPALQKKINDATSGEAVGNFLGGLTGVGRTGSAFAGKEQAERNLQNAKEKISRLQQQAADLDTKIEKLQAEHRSETARLAGENAQSQQQFKTEVVKTINLLIDHGNSRAVLALANVYLKRKDADTDIARLSQQAAERLKQESKALDIAKAALLPVREKMDAGRFWLAAGELKNAQENINNRVTDSGLLQMVGREIKMTEATLVKKINAAGAERAAIMALADSDPVEAEKKFGGLAARYPDMPELEQGRRQLRTAIYGKRLALIMRVANQDATQGEAELKKFLVEYPEFPDADQARQKIVELRNQQIEEKYAKRIAAIEEVIVNDSEEAKKMIKTLMESKIDPDEISILTSKVTLLKRKILEREVELIRADMDEAQGYLTKFNASVSQTHEVSGVAKWSFIQSLTVGTDNLVRARSLQAGAVKRVEVLLEEYTDNVTKAKLVGLMEAQKAAVEQIDGTLQSKHSNKIIVIVGGMLAAVLALGAVGAAVFFIRKKKAGRRDKVVNYYYADENNQPQGPLTVEQLKAMQAAGVLHAESFIIPEDGAQWVPLASVN
ncbi:MAG: GYF domain-containing protein [Verrucomicrobiales bacterium]|jgi:hypothetical protein|nr:GYF domain-containing protein [Verrucomicrobiales bacterium]